MKAAEIRQLTTQEIRERIAETHETITTLHFQHASSQLTNTAQIDQMRRDIARLMTILRERELSGEQL
jgi:large subunit ribosomal protein L29